MVLHRKKRVVVINDAHCAEASAENRHGPGVPRQQIRDVDCRAQRLKAG